MSKNSKKITVNKSATPLETLEDDKDIQLQATPTPTTVIVADVEKKKRIVPPRTDAQKAVLAEGRKKGRESLNAKNAQIQAEKEAMQLQLQKQQEELEKLHKKEFEDKVVKKALAVKKKQIKKAAVLDEISDDETPIDQLPQPKKKPVKASQPAPVVQQQAPPVLPAFKIIFK